MSKEFTKKLAKIQQNLIAPKNQRNTFGNYNYRSCEDIVEALKPLLGDLSLVISDDLVSIGDRSYIKATVTLSDGTDSVSVSALAKEALSQKGMSDSQVTGSTSSYARKYALNGLFLIDDTKDADTDENTKLGKDTKPSKAPPKKDVPQKDKEDKGSEPKKEDKKSTKGFRNKGKTNDGI